MCERGESVRREREGGRGIVCERKESERGRECVQRERTYKQKGERGVCV